MPSALVTSCQRGGTSKRLLVLTRFIAHLAKADIGAVFRYQPLHLSDVGRRLGGRPGQFPVTEDAGDTLVRLPLFVDLTEADQDRVIERVVSFRV